MTGDTVIKYLAEYQSSTTEKIEHNFINFVDDSNPTQVYTNIQDISKYNEAYIYLPARYYNMSMLKMNQDKTNLVIIEKY